MPDTRKDKLDRGALEERLQSQTSFFDTRPSSGPAMAKAATPAAASSAKSKPEPPPHAGHRKRLRERFRKTGPEGLPDYELLEMVLFNAIPRRDTKDLAKAVLKGCGGSFAEVINAPDSHLLSVEGVTDSVVGEFRKPVVKNIQPSHHGCFPFNSSNASWMRSSTLS